MYKSSVQEIVGIAQEFEKALVRQKVTDLGQTVEFPAQLIYILLCNLMPDPKTIKWGPKREELVWGDPNFVVPGKEDAKKNG